MKWKIEHYGDSGHEIWIVTNGERRFSCDLKEDAEWLLEKLENNSFERDIRA